MQRTRGSFRRRALRSGLVLALLFGAPGTGAALSIQTSPADQTVGVGARVAVDVMVRSPGGVRIGGYDVLVSFDPAVLGLVAVDFGTGLGGPQDSIQDVVAGTLGVALGVEVVEVSLLSMLPQDGATDFALFTLLFDALAPGASALDVSAGSDPATDFLADEAGRAVVPSAIVSGRVVVSVAEPALALWLGLAALVAVPLARTLENGDLR